MSGNKKAFQGDAIRELANHTCFVMKKFEHVLWGHCTVRSKLNMFECVWGGTLYSEVQVEQVLTCWGGGSLCVEFQYIMTNGHMGRPTDQND